MKKRILHVPIIFLIIFFIGIGKSYAASSEQLLGFFETPLMDKSPNRVSNIKLAAEKIHQLMLKPGEIFSFNQIVGKRTKIRGFKEASIFENGKVIQGLGGGICQLSSTLYQAALSANLKVTEVHRHSMKVTYIAPGLDAAISWGTKDLKFLNSLDMPISILTEVTKDKVRTSIYKVIDEKPVNVYYNDQLLEVQPPAYTIQGVTYVPLRPLITHLGYLLTWDEQSARITIQTDDTNVILEPHNSIAFVNDMPVFLTNSLKFKDGVTFIPLRFIAEYFSLDISWTEEINSVFINSSL